MPYGPPLDPAQPDAAPRGLVGWFICADLATPPATTSWSNRRLTGFGPFVTTRGGAHCYLPSITALRVLSA